MIGVDGHLSGSGIVQVGESNLVFSSDLLSDDEFADIVKFIPIFIFFVDVSVERLEFGTTWDGHVEGFGGVERLEIEQIEVILVDKITQKLVGQTMQICHNIEAKMPFTIGGTIDNGGVFEGLMIVEPIKDRVIFVFVELHLDGFEWINI